MCHVGRQPVYITFIAFYLYLEYVGWFSTCITILAVKMDTWDCTQMTGSSPIWNVNHLFDVKIEVIPHYFIHDLWHWFLIVLGGVSYTSMQGCMQGVAKVPVIWGVF